MYKKKKKRIEFKNIFIICILGIILILGFWINVFNTDRKLTIFEKAIKDSVLFVGKIVSYPIDSIKNKLDEIDEKNDMYKEYESMKEDLSATNSLISENTELKRQLEETKKLLNLKNSLEGYEVINATVIARDINLWNDTITIDKGENDNVAIGMPVVVSEGLIGKVVQTTFFTSTIRLMTSNNSNDKISVMVNTGDYYVYGILSNYNKETKNYIIEGISQNSIILEETIVTTTGMGDIFPSGIVIGKVTGINTDNFDLASVLEVQSLVNFDNINYVTVLKRSATQ